jgi:phospholipid/cholesterol/gamma-HCH transport system permease protein
MVPIIVLIGDVIGVSGGYFLSLLTHEINSEAYISNIPGNLALWTVFAGVIKSYAFAVVIAVVGCYEGLSCETSADEVGRATTRSVVYCIMLIFAFNLALTTILFPS